MKKNLTKVVLILLCMALSGMTLSSMTVHDMTDASYATPTGTDLREEAVPEQVLTMYDIVRLIHKELGIKFVYDADIDLETAYLKKMPDWKRLKEIQKKHKQNLKQQTSEDRRKKEQPEDRRKKEQPEEIKAAVIEIFEGTSLVCQFNNQYAILKPRPDVRSTADLSWMNYLPVGIGDTTQTHLLKESHITGWRNRKLAFSQTGYKKITGASLRSGVSFLSQPDVIKNLQLQPGVASGTEMLSGFYVHGGNGRDNLFQIDGVEIYSTSHLAGLFSAFNVDVVENIDFYKSGFPARYGGKLSSVVDVTTREGDLYEHHGVFSIGLLNGSIQVDGPIVKGRTTYNVGLRRSWLEPFTLPVLAILNARNKDHQKLQFRYALADLNASITHRFNENNKLSFNVYAGQDFGKFGQINETLDFYNNIRYDGENRNTFGLKWGNLLASLNWKYTVHEKFSFNAIGYYTQSMTHILIDKKKWEFHKKYDNFKSGPTIIDNFQDENNHSRIQDAGFKMDFFYDPDRGNRINFGTDLKMHFYHASQDIDYHQEINQITVTSQPSEGGNGTVDSNSHHSNGINTSNTTFFKDQSASSYYGSELSFYAEDEIGYLDWFKANIGARYVVFLVPGKTYQRIEPRAAVKFQICPEVALKASYTEMNQFTHKMSTHTIELPTFSFLPSNEKIAPMHSRQIAGGIYSQLPKHFTFNIEGWYKAMDNLMEYKGIYSYAPTVTDWQMDFSKGKGRSYGMETELSWQGPKTEVAAYYTLSWNERFFGDLYGKWFPDSHDNRHKLTLLFTHRFNKHFDLNVSWHYHTGDKITEATQYTMEENPHYGQEDEMHVPEGSLGKPEEVHDFYYTSPNNFQLPAYHRMDIGFNWRRTTRRGNESIWNLSLYNAYCHVNAVFAEVLREDGQLKAYQYGFIPIVPMFSYTLKF